jgi:hypothetical protein
VRAREPDSEGVVERHGVRVGYDVYGTRSDPGPAHLVGNRARPAVEGAGALPLAALPGCHRGGAGQRPGRPPGRRRGLHRPGVRRRRGGGAQHDRRADGVRGRAVDGQSARPADGRLVSRPGGGRRRRRRRVPLADPRGHRRATGELRGLGEGEPALLVRRLPGLGRVLLLPGVHRAALHQAPGARRRLGAEDRREDAANDRPARDRRGEHRRRRGHLPPGSLPGAGRPRRPRRGRPLRDGRRARPVGRRRARHLPWRRARSDAARTGADQPADPGLRRAGRACRGRRRCGPGPATAAGARCSSARRSVSAKSAATWRSPTSCGAYGRNWRSTG